MSKTTTQANRSWTQEIEDTFPFMSRAKFRTKYPHGMGDVVFDNDFSAYQHYGFECHSGWKDLLWELCEAIANVYNTAGLPCDIEVHQVKEKFGTLRFYYAFEGGAPNFLRFDNVLTGESLSLDLASLGDRPEKERAEDKNTDPLMLKKREVHAKVADIIRSFEEKSATVCEFCGRPAELRNDFKRLRWIRTLCDECYDAQVERVAQALQKAAERRSGGRE